MCSEDESHLEEEKEQVRRLLREAFPPGPGNRPLSHEEAVECRKDLFFFYPHDLPYYLGLGLEDLLDYHVDEAACADTSDMVFLLNVLLDTDDDISDDDYGWLYGSIALEKRMEKDCSLRLGRIGMFSACNEKQAHAILRWLELTGKWGGVREYESNLRAAIPYWRRRAGHLVR